MNGYTEQFETAKLRDIKARTGPLRIVAHGNFGRFQDADLMMRLLDATQDANVAFEFVGFGAKLEQIPDYPHLTKRPPLPHDQIPGFLETADLGLSFRTSDEIGRLALPVKILEYIATGLPTIVVPVMPDLKPVAKAGAIAQYERTEFEDILAFVLNAAENPQRLAAMRSAALKAKPDFSRRELVGKAALTIMETHRRSTGES